MIRLLIDTNIIIDLLAKREKFYNESADLFSRANKKDFKNAKIPVLTAKEFLAQL